jgi:hypothetical protein
LVRERERAEIILLRLEGVGLAEIAARLKTTAILKKSIPPARRSTKPTPLEFLGANSLNREASQQWAFGLGHVDHIPQPG